MKISTTAHGHTPYYYVPAESRHPVMAAIGLFFMILGAGMWVNGAGWAAGYTGTQAMHGRVVSLDALEVGDLVFYGRAWPYGHVAGYVGGGKVISHGSEGGPYLLPVRYRSDVSHARRYW